jgi:MOSC domain-containing protein YiiM
MTVGLKTGGLELKVLSVNVALPRMAGEHQGAPLLSAFQKSAVNASSIAVGALGLAGDGQADLENHGGPERAVYAYSADNWPWWEKEKHFACAPGTFGENLTLSGAGDDAIRIGDRFSWGETVLEVSQPRTPCFKFQRFSERVDASTLMALSARCGWYFRVLKEGIAPVKPGALVRFAEGGGSVREVFLAASNRASPSRRRELADSPGLSQEWRRKLLAGS